MSVSVLVVIVLLSVSSNVICQTQVTECNNKLINIGIYLMYNGGCYPNGSYFRDVAITIPSIPWFPNSECVLRNSTLSGGEWSRYNGESVDYTNNTNSDPLRCITTDTPVLLYINSIDKAFLHLRINYTSVVYPLAVLM